MSIVLVKLEIGVDKTVEKMIKVPDNYDFWEIDDHVSDWLNRFVKVKWEKVAE